MTRAVSAVRRANVHALHLADARGKLAQRHAANVFPSSRCEQQTTVWRPVHSAQVGNLRGEVLKAEVNLKRGDEFKDQRARCRPVRIGLARAQVHQSVAMSAASKAMRGATSAALMCSWSACAPSPVMPRPSST